MHVDLYPERAHKKAKHPATISSMYLALQRARKRIYIRVKAEFHGTSQMVSNPPAYSR